METNFITFTTEISELKLNKFTNSYYFNFKYNISDNEYHTVDLTGYNQYQSEGIRKDFIDMISNINKIAVDLSEKIENGDILNTSHNIKLEGQKPVNNVKDYSDFNCIQLYITTGEYYDLCRGLIDEDSVEVILVGDNSHLEKGLNYKIDSSGVLELLSIEEQNKNNSEYIFLNGTVRVYFKTIPTQIIRASQAEDKALSQTVIDYLSKQKGVNNKGVKGESIFFEDDNEKYSDSIIRPVGYDEKGNMLFIKHTLQDFQELNKKINKLSEKNKKLKSKNRKLKKQLNKFVLKCNGEVVAFDIDKNTGKKSGKGVKLGNINKLTTGE